MRPEKKTCECDGFCKGWNDYRDADTKHIEEVLESEEMKNFIWGRVTDDKFSNAILAFLKERLIGER